MNAPHSSRQLFWLGAIITSVTALGCWSASPTELTPNPSPKTPVSIVAGETPDQASQDKILAAKEALFSKLSGRLMEVMSTQGPVAAITVCQQEAPEIAKEISESHDLQIGRTGVRLRNTSNVPPDWAVPLVEERVAEPTFAMLSNGHAAGLLPIKLQPQCLMCHGPQDQIAPPVQEQLKRLYPNDQATGFQEGELRGWFWVEVDPSL